MNAINDILRRSVLFPLLLLCFALHAQVDEKPGTSDQLTAKNTEAGPPIKLFSNSESPNLSFMVSTDLKKCRLYVTTNYPKTFKIRFVDYYGRTVKVYRNVGSGDQIDISQFKNKIVILNITENKGNKLLSSQVVNLKRRNYWREGG